MDNPQKTDGEIKTLPADEGWRPLYTAFWAVVAAAFAVGLAAPYFYHASERKPEMAVMLALLPAMAFFIYKLRRNGD